VRPIFYRLGKQLAKSNNKTMQILQQYNAGNSMTTSSNTFVRNVAQAMKRNVFNPLRLQGNRFWFDKTLYDTQRIPILNQVRSALSDRETRRRFILSYLEAYVVLKVMSTLNSYIGFPSNREVIQKNDWTCVDKQKVRTAYNFLGYGVFLLICAGCYRYRPSVRLGKRISNSNSAIPELREMAKAAEEYHAGIRLRNSVTIHPQLRNIVQTVERRKERYIYKPLRHKRQELASGNKLFRKAAPFIGKAMERDALFNPVKRRRVGVSLFEGWLVSKLLCAFYLPLNLQFAYWIIKAGSTSSEIEELFDEVD